jgi:hypothetical protein
MVITKLKMAIDIDAARKYYDDLCKHHADAAWSAQQEGGTISCWSMHSLKGASNSIRFHDPEPCGVENYNQTPQVFGWSKYILNDLFPFGYRSFLIVSGPGTHMRPHFDDCWESMVRIHFPIYTNPDAFWLTDDGRTHMEPGYAYIFDTSKMHETFNNGSTNRVHFGINIPRTRFEEVRDNY